MGKYHVGKDDLLVDAEDNSFFSVEDDACPSARSLGGAYYQRDARRGGEQRGVGDYARL